MCTQFSNIIRESEGGVTDSDQIFSFLTALSATVTDPRDNRGKRHNLIFVIIAVALAIMARSRSKVSNIRRYIENKIGWLREITGMPDAEIGIAAHLPRLLSVTDWQELSETIEIFFGVRIERRNNDEWVAVDGKTLRSMPLMRTTNRGNAYLSE